MRFAVEAWAPDYGSSSGDLDVDAAEVTATVETSIETPQASWAPRDGRGARCTVTFVDGISRMDAQVWITDGEDARPGLCATYAAGAVRCDGRATVTDVRVRRGLFTASGTATPIDTKHASYQVRAATGDLDALSLSVVERMRHLEADVAHATTDADLIVLDGLLWGRESVANAVGYVKTQKVAYLPAELGAVVDALQPGQRTPLFLITTSWTRFSWYVKLPGAHGHRWAGIVRCEATPDRPATEVAALADLATGTLPRFASAPHKDARAPQNLYPIAGLERELRRRAGDPQLLYRALRAAAFTATPA